MRLLSLFPVLFLLAAPASAQAVRGQPMPELPSAQWLRPPAAERLEDLCGQPVVIGLVGSYVTDPRGCLFAMIQEWRHWYRDEVPFLLLSDQPRSEVEKMLAGIEVPFGVAANCEASREWDVGAPALLLVGPDGRLEWLSYFEVDVLRVQLGVVVRRTEKARLAWDPGERIPELAAAVDHAVRQRFGKAWTEAEKQLRVAGEDAARAEAVQTFLADLEAEGARREARAAEFAASGRYALAQDYLATHGKLFAGTPAGERMTATLRAWQRDREIKKLAAFDERRRAALATIYDQDNLGKGRKLLQELASEAEGTPLAAVIARDLAVADL